MANIIICVQKSQCPTKTNQEKGTDQGREKEDEAAKEDEEAMQTEDDLIERNLELVPYGIEPEIVAITGQNEENSMFKEKGENILQKARLFGCFDIPPIPLCRLITHAKVRGLRDDVTGLKSAFDEEGYVPEKGVFIVSLWTREYGEVFISQDLILSWDPIWQGINAKFEEEIALREDLAMLKGRLFYVWEGNHRTVAWMACIKERWQCDHAKHIRVLCTVIDPSKVSELMLLSCLQRLNFLNQHALVSTTLRDEIVNASNICKSNANDFLKELSAADIVAINKIRRKGTKGVEPWFPLTRRYLARLVYSVQINRELEARLDILRATHTMQELVTIREKEMDEVIRKYGDRMGKILNICDPILGLEWWENFMSLRWSSESYATIEKLNLIALQEVSSDVKCQWLALLEANKTTKNMLKVPRGDHEFRRWIDAEVTLEKIIARAHIVLEDSCEVAADRIEFPPDCTLRDFYMEVKLEVRHSLFFMETRILFGRDKKTEFKEYRKLDLIQMAAQRVVYRYMRQLVDKRCIARIPVWACQWLSSNNNETSMYPPYLCSLSAWEIEHCPWWIDMESGYLLVSEREIHRQQNENTRKQEKIIGDKGKRVEKPVEDEIETVELDAPHTNLDAQAIVGRRSMRFVHLLQHISSNSQRVSRSSHSLALAGDYVAIGRDFASSIKNKTYGMLHEHVLQHRPQGREYVRIGRHVSWAADMVFLDLPFGGVLDGMHSSLAWDSFTEDHVRYGVAVAAASLSDSGWLLVMASLAGHAMRWLEQYCRFSDLEIWHRVSILHHTPYGYLDLLGHRVECDMSSLLLIRRHGTEPSLRYVESLPFFTTMGMQPLDTRVCHYLPPRHRHTREDGMEWRGPLQRSHSFLQCYMELLCPHDGIVFEMGCGTGPMMRASLETDRLCVSIDSDERIVAEAVQPLLLARKSLHGEESSSSAMGADEVDIAAGHNPFD